MSLPDINWRKLQRIWVAITDNTPRRSLDALFTTMGLGTYYDGSVRVPGAGSAITVAREQAAGVTEGVYWSYVTGALNHRGIVAGQNIATKSPTMAAPDTFVANELIMSVIKNAGAYATWDAAAVYTGGTNHGYFRAIPMGAPPTTFRFDVYESQEAVAISAGGTGGGVCGGFTGAYLDPQSTHASDAESDGRVYGMMTVYGGIDTIWSNGSREQEGGGTYRWTDDSPSNTGPHNRIFNPGLGSSDGIQKQETYINVSAAQFSTIGGRVIVLTGMPFRKSSDGRFRGSSRNWGLTKNNPSGSVLRSGGVDVAYVDFSSGIYGQNVPLGLVA